MRRPVHRVLALALACGLGAVGCSSVQGGSTQTPSPMEGSLAGLTFVSWNVWGKLSSDATLDQIVVMKPDVLFLCEAGDENEVRGAAEALEADRGEPFEVFYADPEWGSFAFISRYPFDSTEAIEAPDIKKVLMHVDVTAGDEQLSIFGLHGLTASNHNKHREEAEAFLAEIEQRTGNQRTVVVGDFNSRSSRDGAVNGIEDSDYDQEGYKYPNIDATTAFEAAGFLDTQHVVYPGRAPRATKMRKLGEESGSSFAERIDYCFTSSDLKGTIRDAGVHSETTNKLSDHKPVWCRLDVGGNLRTQGGKHLDDSPTIDSSTLGEDNQSLDITFSEGIYADPEATRPVGEEHFEVTFNAHKDGNATDVMIVGVTRPDGGALRGGEEVVRVLLAVEGIPNGEETIKVHLAADIDTAQKREPRHIYTSDGTPDHWSRMKGDQPYASVVRTRYHRLFAVE